jgi:microcystin-dependent protein
MISRRMFFAGAAALAVAPTAMPAAALPARLLESSALPPPAGFIPCDGRELPIAGYEQLFEMLKHTGSWSADTQTFRVPDMRAMAAECPVLANGVIVLEDVIATGHDPRVPAGTILLMEPPHAPG